MHEELFAEFDCSRCRNCCKMYSGSIPEEDVDRDAKCLSMTRKQFMDTYLQDKTVEGNYQTKHMSCDFLESDDSYRLGDCKPDSCKKYPYTNQPERLQSVLDVIEVCPVALEIYERLKREYHFRWRNR